MTMLRSISVCATTAGLLLSCSDDTPKVSTGKPPGDDVGTDAPALPTTSFAPTGCDYIVGQVDQYPGFEAHADVLGTKTSDKNYYGPNPTHVRIGLGGNADVGKKGYADPSSSVAVVWQTDATTMASRMKIGESATSLDKSATGFSYVIAQDPGFATGPADGVRFHEVHVCGLTPGRTYYYQVGGGPAGTEVFSKVASFTTAPAAGGKDPVSFGFSGDTRDHDGNGDLAIWRQIGSRVKAAGVRMMTFSGDFVYLGTSEDMWYTWGNAADPFASEMFVAMGPGNHDNEQLRYFANALMPGNVGANFERYASFDYGPVHVVMIDDYDGIVSESIDSTSYKTEVLAWIDKDLAAADANRAKVPWIMTFHHHPFFSSTTQTERAAERAKVIASLESIYEAHHVDFDVAGHDHFYERSKPILGGKASADGKGTRYVICAGGGADAYSTKPTDVSEKIVGYDPTKLEGLYGIATATATQLDVKVYKMNGPSGSSPADDTVVDTWSLTR